jgi:hypothetical protein
MLPEMAIYVLGADAVVTALRSGKVPWLLAGVVVAVGVALAFVAQRVRRRIATERLKALEKELAFETEPAVLPQEESKVSGQQAGGGSAGVTPP